MLEEIIFIATAGLITVGLSINSLLKSNKQEKELTSKQAELVKAQGEIIVKQNSMIELQKKFHNEVQRKSDEVIQLQNQLKEKSENQLKEINRLSNPIPDNFEIDFTSKILLTNKEFLELRNAFKSEFPDRGNFLPADFTITNPTIDKINALKDVIFNITIEFQSGEKKLVITMENFPKYIGYQTSSIWGAFNLSFLDKEKELQFQAFRLKSSLIKCNYLSPSIIDFKNSNVKIKYSFLLATSMLMGDKIVKEYMGLPNGQVFLELKFDDIQLVTRDYQIKLSNLTKVGDHSFQTHYKG